jgi:GcrA cell cycle regulator
VSRFNVTNAGWSGEALDWLREHWLAMTKGQLADVLGCSPNAVAGKAHRMDLPKKPGTPRSDTPRIHKPHRKGGVAERRAPKPKPPRPILRGLYEIGTGCAWPIGHPGQRSFRFCCDDPANNSPYCLEHYKLAYIPRRHAAAEGVAAP